MRILFIGGTGIISTACSQLAVARGFDLTVLNRGRSAAVPGVRQITADIEDPQAAHVLARQHWDAVVDFIAYTPAQIERRIALLRGCVGQYLFISSASAYQKPVTHYLHTESTPLVNPFWSYSRDKIGCEDRLMQALREENFPATIVRPSFTYGDTLVPLALNSWPATYTAVDRMRRGLPIIIPGDGTSLWTMTHNSDFALGLVGLLGHQAAIGHTFHITSDEVLSWNQIYQAVADAAVVAQPDFVHIASDFIAACLPEATGGLHGDKSNSVVCDNSKIKRFVPDYLATVRFRDGIRRTLQWFDADPARQGVNAADSQAWDRLVTAYRRGLDGARREFGQ